MSIRTVRAQAISKPQATPDRMGIITTSLLSALALAACESLDLGGTTVTGTGDPAKDVPAVQAAVDAGGHVALRGAFDFGERGRVVLRRDVEVVGLEGAVVRGGFFSFFSPVPEALPPAAPGPKVSIRNLGFEGALWAPINIGYASGLVVTGNRISALRPHPLPLPGVADSQTQAGILFGMAWAQGMSNRRYAPGVFTGTVRIENNIIDVLPARPAATLGYGIYGQWSEGIDATIAGNTVTGASRTAFEAIDNYRGADGRGRLMVQGNRLATAAEGVPFPGRQTPNGVLVGYFADRKAGTDPARILPTEVVGNTIETRGAASMGLAVMADGVRVRGNTVTINGASSLPLMVAGSEVEVSGNVLRGNGSVGVLFNPFDVFAASRNRLAGNDFSGFKGERAHVVINKGAADNVCNGNQPTLKVVDDGERTRCP